jgi:4-amino-4-deoxy-L-arabinose transferase-like glycosyltransferase
MTPPLRVDRPWPVLLPPGPARSAAAIAAILSFAAAAAAAGGPLLLPPAPEDVPLALLAWLAVLAAAAAGALAEGALASRALAPTPPREHVSKGATWALGGFVAALGAALRLAPESLVPFRLWIDTLAGVRLALRSPGTVPWYGGSSFGDGAAPTPIVAPNAWAAYADALFGAFGVGEPTLLALSALPSIAAILVVAWLAYEVWGRETALIATILVSLSLWPIVHGRWGYTSAGLLPFALAGAAALVRAGRRGSVAWAGAGGALAGATVHTYPSAWPFLVALGPALFVAWRGPGEPRRQLAAAGAGTAAMVLLVLPAWIGRPDRLGGRAREAWLGAPTRDVAVPGADGIAGIPFRLAYNAWLYGGLLAGEQDPNPRHGLPGRAPLSPVLGALALAGAAITSRARRPAGAVLAAAAGGGLLAGVLSSPGGAPNTQRAALFAMTALVLAAAAISALPRTRTGALVAAGTTAVVLAALDVRVVLGPWSESRAVESAYLPVEVEAGRLLARLAPDPVVLVHGAVAHPFAVETLASAGRPRPVSTARRVGREALAAGAVGEGAGLWIVGRPGDLEAARAGGLRVGRGTVVSPLDPAVLVARAVRPPR